ncbi:MAG TPA: hypothetical protein VLC06_27905 [Polyangia bacterium]|nr:hypothetical protein [Polyangia bacterium]
MIRNSLKLTALAGVALVGGALGLNCSKGGSTDSGDLKIAFVVPGGTDTINSVTYKVTATASGTTLVSGSMNTSDPNATASLDLALPPTAAGATDTVILTATTTAGVACSTAATTFTVTSGANTNVMLSMVCGTSVPQTIPGTVDITTTVSSNNSCPSITSAVVAPDQTSVGASVAISATGVDPDGDSLTYSWGPAANVAAPTAQSTTYTCLTAGTQPITLGISDGKCNATVTLQIICVGAGAGGTGGAAGAPATGGVVGTGGVVATGGVVGTGGSTVSAVACASCEFNDSQNFCSGTTVSGNLDTTADFGCNSLTSATDITNCQNLVMCLRSTSCQTAITTATSDYAEAGSNFDDPHPCLCGGVTLAACLGATTWTGPCAAQYVAAANGGSVLNNYGNSASPIGLANNLMTCDVDSQIASNGLQTCGASCGLNTATPAN